MDLDQVKKLVSDGKFFSVEFIKRSDGQLRRMLARTGVTSGLTGEGRNYNPDTHNLITVFDVQKRAYRNIPVDNITWIKAHGVERRFGLAKRTQRA
jgi:hypothetical protein